MHEMSLAQGVVRIVAEQAVAQHFTAVKTVWLELGALSHVEPEALAFCFDVVARDTVAEGARLEILRTPGQGWCMACAQAIPVATRLDPCPRCGGYQVQVTAGDAMRVKELEVV
ncbi:MAG TPA: hydrogenase maturation nickel metallochaperone HypA [bacterium]|jgi:hydrogenase nickel incorporation protein HypA/HybF